MCPAWLAERFPLHREQRGQPSRGTLPWRWGHSWPQGRAVAAWVARRAAPALRPGLQDKPCQMAAARRCAPARCVPWGAPERLDPLAHPPLGAGSQASPGWPRRSSAATHPSLSHRGSAWVISSIALFISVQQEKRLTVALKE